MLYRKEMERDAKPARAVFEHARGRRAIAACLAAIALAVAMLVATPVTAQQADARRAWLGVELERGPAGGVVAKHVIRMSPAAKAGIVDGDLLVSADGTALEEPKQLVARVALVGPGNTMKLSIR